MAKEKEGKPVKAKRRIAATFMAAIALLAGCGGNAGEGAKENPASGQASGQTGGQASGQAEAGGQQRLLSGVTPAKGKAASRRFC